MIGRNTINATAYHLHKVILLYMDASTHCASNMVFKAPRSSLIATWILSNTVFKTSHDNDSLQLVLNNEIRLINKNNII